MDQITPSDFCLNCRICCTFAEKKSEWIPHLSSSEIEHLPALDQYRPGMISEGVLTTIYSEDHKCFICSFLDKITHKCVIYSDRPFECAFYPFLINKTGSKVFLAIDRHCPFVKKEESTDKFKKHLEKTVELVQQDAFRDFIKNTPRLVHSYDNVQNICEIIL